MFAIQGFCFYYIGGLAGAKTRCLLDGGVRYLDCLLKEVTQYCHGLSFTLCPMF